ncbi:hypothetical protein QTP88_026992 [Uroleucon formosanum]
MQKHINGCINQKNPPQKAIKNIYERFIKLDLSGYNNPQVICALYRNYKTVFDDTNVELHSGASTGIVVGAVQIPRRHFENMYGRLRVIYQVTMESTIFVPIVVKKINSALNTESSLPISHKRRLSTLMNVKKHLNNEEGGIGIVTITKYLLYTPTIQATPSQTSSDEYRWCTAVEIPNMFHIYFILLIFCVCRNVKLVNASVKEMAADGRKRKAKYSYVRRFRLLPGGRINGDEIHETNVGGRHENEVIKTR